MNVLLMEMEFNLEVGGDEQVIVSVPSSNLYKTAVEYRKDWLNTLKTRSICGKMKRSWEEMESNEGEQEHANRKINLQKRRKILKGLKKYTGLADTGERKFKGWTDSGHKAFENWTVSIKCDVERGKYSIWEKAFREVQANHRAYEIQTAGDPMEKYEVSRSVVWEL